MCFRNSLLKIGRPVQNSIFKAYNPLGIKFLTRLWLGLSHLNEHKFKYNFQNCLNPLCSWKLKSNSLEVESTIHFFLHCHFFYQFWQILVETVEKIIKDISHLNNDLLVNQLMYGNLSYSFEGKIKIINASIKYVLDKVFRPINIAL